MHCSRCRRQVDPLSDEAAPWIAIPVGKPDRRSLESLDAAIPVCPLCATDDERWLYFRGDEEREETISAAFGNRGGVDACRAALLALGFHVSIQRPEPDDEEVLLSATRRATRIQRAREFEQIKEAVERSGGAWVAWT